MSSKDTALVTGASGGIGMELATIRASKGGNLVLAARTQKLEQLKSELEQAHKVSVTVITEDLVAPEAAQQIYEKTRDLEINMTSLINNAGFGGHGLFHERTLSADQAMMQVNMVSLTNLTLFYVKDMVANIQGKILNVSSTASFMPGPLQAVYYATKAYVTSFAQAIAEEVFGHGVTATALCPGTVDTDFVAAGNLEDVDAWKHAKSARSAAECGYKAMERGQLVAFNEGGLKFTTNWIVPLLPCETLLRISRKFMEK